MDSNKKENFYAKVLLIMGWVIIILGLIGSIVLGNTFLDRNYNFNFLVFLYSALSCAVFGFLVLGLAEIVRILHDNNMLLTTISNNNIETPKSLVSSSNTIIEELPEI